VWLAPTFREEHRQALDLLNDLGGERVRFFAVELRVVRIGESPPAPLLELRAQPNDWHAQLAVAASAGSRAGRKATAYAVFWARLLKRLRVEHPDWSRAQKPSSANWFPMPCPFKGGSFYSFTYNQGGRMRSELYIDDPDPDRARGIYDALLRRRTTIEAAYGGQLSWEELSERRACRIADYADGDVLDEEAHDEFIDWFFDAGTRLRRAIDGIRAEIALDDT
jgi:hypothetical protein